MNQLGIELYKQAAEFAHNTIGKEHADTTYFQATVAGKFAELIVQECARVAKATACPYQSNELTPQNAHTWDMASIESGKGILDHFGID